MGLLDEITKPFKNIGKELGKVGKDIGFDKWGPWAMMLVPFTPWGAALKGMQPEWFQGIMKTKFMNSAFGAAIKDSAAKYMLAVAMDKEHPEDVFKSSFVSNMALGYYKTGGDMGAFFGKAPTPAFADRVIGATPATYGQDLPYGYEKYGQRLQDKWYGPGRGGVDLAAMQGGDLGIQDYSTTLGDYYKDWSPERGWKGFEDIGKAPLPRAIELSPAMEAMTIPGKDIQGPVTEAMMADAKAPLAGMGLQKRIKTKPSFWETKGMPYDMKVGSPAYDEFFGIGKEQWDPMYVAKSAYDLMMTGGPTEEDLERERRKKMEQFREDLMWRPEAPSYFDDFFLGKSKGGIASLAHGGRIGYQGGGIGPAGADPEELKRRIKDQISMEMAMGPGGSWSGIPADPDDPDALPPLPLDMMQDIPFDQEFEGFLDLASGDPATDYKDMWEQYNDQAIRIGFPPISFDEFMELRGESGVEAGARGGRMGYQGGGELNVIPGGAVSGPGTGTSDSIPAKLSNNEFVFTENAVRAAGGGDVNAGAQQLYGIMNALDPGSARVNEPPVYS